jgi:hypothetical protein
VEYDAFRTILHQAQAFDSELRLRKVRFDFRSVDWMIDTVRFRRKRTAKADGSIDDRPASAINLTYQLQAVEEGIAGHKSVMLEEGEHQQKRKYQKAGSRKSR